MSKCCSHESSPKAPLIVAPVVASCCGGASPAAAQPALAQVSCCDDGHGHGKKKIDYLLWGSLILCVVFYSLHMIEPMLVAGVVPNWLHHLGHSVFEMLNTMWWGVLMGLVFVGLLANIPQNLVMSILGKGGSVNGILRATLAGVLLDLCSHGILMVGMKLYQKGASIGQVMAFLIASPWNSFSLTLIMFALIGFKWTITFIVLSMVIAIISGWLFDRCVDKNILPANPNKFELDENFKFWPEAKKQWQSISWSFDTVKSIAREGVNGSRMVIRWLLFGVLLAASVRSFVSLEFFQQWFGPSLIGMVFTLIAATVIEVCSEGSAPIAADLLSRAAAPGNAFTFMMAGVSTDYTEVMVLKDTTHSWKIALFLPLITLPQVVAIGYVLNNV